MQKAIELALLTNTLCRGRGGTTTNESVLFADGCGKLAFRKLPRDEKPQGMMLAFLRRGLNLLKHKEECEMNRY